jgi:hypothetical protein
MKFINKYILAFLAIIVFSCNINDLELDKIKNPTFSPHLGIKLGSASYTIKELVDDIEDAQLEVQEGTDFLLTFVYRDTSEFNVSNDFVDIGSIQNATTTAGGNTFPAIPGIIIPPISINQTFTFDFEANDGELLDSIFYKSGSLDISMSSGFSGSFNLDFTILNTIDETDMDLSGNISGNSTTPGNFTRDLLGLKTIINNTSGKNEFQFKISGQIQINTGSAVTPDQELSISIGFNNPGFSSIFGNFGSKSVEIANQTIDMAGFQEFGDTGLEFNAPKIIMELDNSYGLGMGLTLSGVRAVNGDGSQINLTGDIVANGVLIEGASNLDVGSSKTSIIEINKANSNIADLLNSTPNSMIFPVVATLNPASSTLTTNFLTDSSKMVQRTIVEMPLDVKMEGFSRAFDFDLSDLDIDGASEMTLRLITINEIPFSGTITLQFLDAGGNSFHEVANNRIINSPTNLDNDGRTITPNESVEDIVLDQNGIDAFLDAKKIKVIMSIESFDAANGTFIKVFSDYKLDIKLSMSGKFSIVI